MVIICILEHHYWDDFQTFSEREKKRCLNVANDWSILSQGLVGYTVIYNSLILETLLGRKLDNLLTP